MGREERGPVLLVPRWRRSRPHTLVLRSTPQTRHIQTKRVHKCASAAGSGHGSGSSRMHVTIYPAAVGANECLPSNSVTGKSAKSERSLMLERYFVKTSTTFLSPPIFSTTTIPSSILSRAQKVCPTTLAPHLNPPGRRSF